MKLYYKGGRLLSQNEIHKNNIYNFPVNPQYIMKHGADIKIRLTHG